MFSHAGFAASFRLLALHGVAAGGWWGVQASKLAQCMLAGATSAASSGGGKGGGGRDGNGQGRAKLGGGATAGEPFDMFAASHFQMDTGWHISKSIFANFRMVCAARVVGPGCSRWLFPFYVCVRSCFACCGSGHQGRRQACVRSGLAADSHPRTGGW